MTQEVNDVLFTKGTIPNTAFVRYQKIRATPAVRIEGTFHCLTSEGNVASCTDGWLAIDSRGYPYPVNDYEFALSYRVVEDGDDGQLEPRRCK